MKRSLEVQIRRPGENQLEAARVRRRTLSAFPISRADNAENMDLSRIASPAAKDFARLDECKAVVELLLAAAMP